jgi:hypothetical protein
MKTAQPPSVTIRQIEFELEKAEHGMGMPYDPEGVSQLRSMLREARKKKLFAGLKARREQR